MYFLIEFTENDSKLQNYFKLPAVGKLKILFYHTHFKLQAVGNIIFLILKMLKDMT